MSAALGFERDAALRDLLEDIERRDSFYQLVIPTAPAAGANLSITLDSRWVQRLISARVTLTTDANAANRALTIDYLDASGTVYNSDGAGLVVTANTTQIFQFQTERTSGEWASNTLVWAPINQNWITSGGQNGIATSSIRFTVGNIQVGDTLTAIRVVFERYDSGP